jgi:integrase
MSIYKEAGKWRYEFQAAKVRYTRSGFATKAEALAAREAHKKEVKAGKPAATGMGLLETMNEYMDFCKRRFSEKNYKEKVFIFKTFMAHLGADWQIGNCSARDISGYLGGRPTNTNWNKHRKSICAFFQWAFKNGLVNVNPCIHVETMPETPAQKKIPTQEEMLKILLAAGDFRPFFITLFALAARYGEINNLRWEDVSFEKRIVSLWTRKGNGTYRAQIKPLNDELYDELRRLYGKRSGEWVFPNPETGLPYKNRRKQIKNVCKAAGVPNYGWHSIRHHVASLLADYHKISLPTVQRMLGHANLTTTQRYIHSLTDGVREAGALLQISKPHNQTTQTGEPIAAK